MKIPHTRRLEYIHSRLSEVRFPIADLIKNTGMDRGNISKMYNGKKPVSDSFWEKFISHYGQKPVKLPNQNEVIKKLDIIIELLEKKRK